ncbi:MAG: hypothetical protein ACWGQW_03780 [bacterium]
MSKVLTTALIVTGAPVWALSWVWFTVMNLSLAAELQGLVSDLATLVRSM